MTWYFLNGLKKNASKFKEDIGILTLVLIASFTVSKVDFFHDHWPYWMPEIFENILFWYKTFIGEMLYSLTFFGASVFLYYALIGRTEILREKRIKNAVKILSKGNDQTYPRVIEMNKVNSYRTKIVVESPYVGVDAFVKEQNNLEAGFDQQIERIVKGSSPRYVHIYLNTKKLPKKFSYSAVKDECDKPNHFILGETNSGLLTQDIRELPHMLIAGTTNFGKSNFFKQVLTTLLKNTDHLQMHLIDLKGGLEMRAFADLPNVNFIKDIDQALSTLSSIKKEMDSRFQFLYDKGFNKLLPKRDKKDRIIVAIDEASVLYMKKYSRSDEGMKAQKARQITDDLAKLARAAGINLIIATQKVTKETLDTHIRENMSGRVSFKANDNEASRTVLGNNMAANLPAVAGRAIFNFGNTFEEFQAPLLTDKDIEDVVSETKKDFAEGLRTLFQPGLIDNSAIRKTQKDKEIDG